MLFDIADFKVLYPEFEDESEALIKAIATQGDCFLPKGCCDVTLKNLSMLLVAHMLKIREMTASGRGIAVSSASEGSVSVSLAMPSDGGALAQWLNITTYGQMYAAMAARCGKGRAAAGLYFSGFSESDAFRKAYGEFTRGGRR